MLPVSDGPLTSVNLSLIDDIDCISKFPLVIDMKGDRKTAKIMELVQSKVKIERCLDHDPRKAKLFSSSSSSHEQPANCRQNQSSLLDRDLDLSNQSNQKSFSTRSSISSCQSSIDVTSCNVVRPLSNLIRRKQWRKVARLLKIIETKMGQRYDPQRSNILCLSGGLIQETEENCLHLACRFNAPFSLIQRLCAISPDLVSECSSEQKATPLHVAVSNKSVSIEVVNFLVSQDANMSSVKDVNMCTPLHLICRLTDCGRNIDPYDDPFVTYPALACQEEVSLVIKALCEVYPWYINDEDCFGMTPIEYAIEANLEYSLIKYMWALSSSQWKNQQECAKKVKRAFCESYDNQSEIQHEDFKNIKHKTFHDADADASHILSDSPDQQLYSRLQDTRRSIPPYLFKEIASIGDIASSSDEDNVSDRSLRGMILETTRERKQRRIRQ